MTERTNLTPEEREARLRAWQEQNNSHDPLPFVQGIIEGRRAGDVWQELHPNTTPSSCNESASRALAEPKVKTLITEAQMARARKTGVDTAWVVERLKIVVERCMAEIEIKDRHGNPTGQWRFDSAGAVGALKLLAKHVGGFEDTVKIQADEKTRDLLEEYKRIAAANIVEGTCQVLS